MPVITKQFQNLPLPQLGFGSMRLPLLPGGGDEDVDQAAVDRMVDTAMARGANYFDTAYGYHGGKSEVVMGKALSRYPRESFFLADKFPGYDVDNIRADRVEAIFEEQLRRCGVEYFDFYLFHNVYERNVEPYLDPENRVVEYLLEQKRNGRIRHLGFSAHGDYDVMKRFLEAYGKDMEFCQIQLNYLDWDFQDAKRKVELLNQWNIPVWVMEPLRGGKLASLAPEDEAKLKALRPDEGIPAWAFRYLQSIPSVVVTLSGMPNMEQMKENIATFETDKPLNETELETLHAIAQGMVKKIVLPCTACHYCTSHCPQGLDIPNLLSLYNEHCFTQGGFIAPMALSAIPADKQPSACIGCRSCEAVCPQGIKISEAMADFTAKLGG